MSSLERRTSPRVFHDQRQRRKMLEGFSWVRQDKLGSSLSLVKSKGSINREKVEGSWSLFRETKLEFQTRDSTSSKRYVVVFFLSKLVLRLFLLLMHLLSLLYSFFLDDDLYFTQMSCRIIWRENNNVRRIEWLQTNWLWSTARE